MSNSLFTPMTALRLMIQARDHYAAHSVYPSGTVEPGQGFDDWAADLAQRVLDDEPAKALTMTFSDDACDTWTAMLKAALTYCVCINKRDYRLEAIGTDALVVRDWNGGDPDSQPPTSIPLSSITHVHIY